MGKKKRLSYKSKKLGKKYSSHPRARTEETQSIPVIETVVIPTKEEKIVEDPVIPVIEVVKEAPKPKRTRRTRKSSTAPKRKTAKPKAKEEE